jgi:acetoin utilization deacetylase AcuC-like enzyme
VLFISSHQFPYYPGTGAAHEIGEGRGKGFTVNLPLAAGAQDGDYGLVYATIAFPVLRQFRPNLILVSAGVDAHADDPLAGMRLTTEEFGRLTSGIVAVANECCGGRVVAVSEGGYDLKAFGDSLRQVLRTLGDKNETEELARRDGPTPRGTATLNEVRPHLRAHWQL